MLSDWIINSMLITNVLVHLVVIKTAVRTCFGGALQCYLQMNFTDVSFHCVPGLDDEFLWAGGTVVLVVVLAQSHRDWF